VGARLARIPTSNWAAPAIGAGCATSASRSCARSAHYWSGRAFEKLGDRARSLAVFAEVTRADTADFYSRQAALRLSGAALWRPGATRSTKVAGDPQIDGALAL
jgi:aryl-alcohol dehydrogenase-like predicted oxidoreductase